MCPRCKSRLYSVPRDRPLELGHGHGIDEVLAPHRGEILRIAQRYGARNVRVFGSVRRREAHAKSDVDLLVDWIGPSNRLHLQVALSVLLNRDVDVVSPSRLRWSVAPAVLREAVPL